MIGKNLLQEDESAYCPGNMYCDVLDGDDIPRSGNGYGDAENIGITTTGYPALGFSYSMDPDNGPGALFCPVTGVEKLLCTAQTVKLYED